MCSKDSKDILCALTYPEDHVVVFAGHDGDLVCDWKGVERNKSNPGRRQRSEEMFKSRSVRKSCRLFLESGVGESKY